jgi:CRISPR/Cas system-associated exonuclease Cas4 (RecB family)
MSAIKRFPFSDILGWSATRYETFSLCRRKYFYQYYSKYDREVPKRLIQELRGLSSIPLAIGSAVHTVIETLLTRLRRTSQDIQREQFSDFAFRETRNRAQSETFQEVYYRDREGVSVDDLYPKVQVCLENLLASDRYRWLVEEAAQASADWVIEPPGYGETRLNGLKAYFKVDFLFPVGQHYHILDWKTGKAEREKHRKQLLGYSAWTSYHYEVEAERVVPAIAYLHPSYQEVEEVFNTLDLEHFGIQVKAETEEMYEYCLDVDKNIPLEKDQFPRVDDPRICSHCEFRGLCFPEQYPLRSEPRAA